MTVRLALAFTFVLAGCSEYDVRGPSEAVTSVGGPSLLIEPAVHDFGQVSIPCDDTVVVKLNNVGDSDLEITKIRYESGGMLEMVDGPSLPIIVAPGERTSVTVRALAQDVGQDFGTITVTSNDPEGKKTGEQAAEANGHLIMETFTEPGIAPVDVMFLIDQSCSMASLAEANITAGMPAFVSTLQGVADWQLIQVTQDSGCANGGILDETVTNAASLLSTNAFGMASGFTYTEALLELADIALSKTGPGQCNEGFRRPDASLHILVASDEAEQSGQSYNHWLGQYMNYVTSQDQVTVSGIINVASDNACSGFNGGSPAGYAEAVAATGGVAIDICQSGWGSQLTDIATATVASQRVYNLSNDALPDTLLVLVNGVPATDWEFVDSTNSVSIYAPLIGEDDLVEIGYGIPTDCSAEE